MKRFFLPTIAITLSVVAQSLFSPCEANAQQRGGNKATATETYMVVKVTDDNKTDNKVEYKVISSTQIKDEEKRVKDDNAEKLKEWRDLIKTDPQTPRPSKILIRKLKTGYQTQKIAQEYADKLKDEEANKVVTKPKDNKQ